jgi:hypothetical protein
MDAHELRIFTAIAGLLALCGTGTGCATMGKASLWGQHAEVVKPDQATNPQTAAPAGKYVVEFRDTSGRGSSSEFSLAGPINIHEALQQAGAIKKFKRIKIELVRTLPKGGFHRMPVEYDRSIRRVPAECDYGILPGDRIIVSEDNSNIFSDMMNSAQEGMFLSNPKSGKTKNGTFRVAG